MSDVSSTCKQPVPPITIGISTKMYLGYAASCAWLEEVVRIAQASPAVRDGRVSLFVAPSFPVLETALRLTRGTPVKVGAQNASDQDAGALTGEVSPSFLAEMGVALVELGHAERRRHFGEDDGVTAAKVAGAQRNGLVPLLCVGELERTSIEDAAQFCLDQVATAAVSPAGPAPLLAYEPVWAIGAAEPAGADHVRGVVGRMKAELPGDISVIYGGSAGPGLLPLLQPEVDGLFLGRFAHDPKNLERVLAEAAGQ